MHHAKDSRTTTHVIFCPDSGGNHDVQVGYFFRPDRLVVSFTLISAGGNVSQVEFFSRPGRLRPGSVRLSWEGEGVPQGLPGISSTLMPSKPATVASVESLVGLVLSDLLTFQAFELSQWRLSSPSSSGITTKRSTM
jgi:hypothetical protein